MEGPTEKCLGKLGSLIKYHYYCHHYDYFPISDYKYIKIIELFELHYIKEMNMKEIFAVINAT